MEVISPISEKNIRSDALGRYYTKSAIGEILVRQMKGFVPGSVLDLGAGEGALSLAALSRWSTIDLWTVDIDKRAQSMLNRRLKSEMQSRHNHISRDALSVDLPELLAQRIKNIDAAVCNPPFTSPKWRRGFAEIIEDAGFSGCIPVLSDVDAALLFLAQNLRLITENGTLGIILPDTLVSSVKYRSFRKELLDRYMVEKVIRLPRNSFLRTEAQAYIMVIKKGVGGSKNVPLHNLKIDQSISDKLTVNIEDAATRMDYEYHIHKSMYSSFSKHSTKLKLLALELKRGSLTSSYAKKHSLPVLHTTNLQCEDLGNWLDFSSCEIPENQFESGKTIVRAEPGDILVARVGRNLEKKVVGVKKGNPVLTDCVYKIQVPKMYQDRILTQLSSASGQLWLASRAYGVGAKQLTKEDLFDFPVDVSRMPVAQASYVYV